MARAIALAREHGLGCIALANTNHWMRGGAYSGGRSTSEIDGYPERETGLSQVFVAFSAVEPIGAAVLEHFRGAARDAMHPGERTRATRERSLREGVEVDERVWEEVATDAT